MMILVTSNMVVQDPGVYTSSDGKVRIFLKSGDIVPNKEGESLVMRLAK